MRMTAGVAGLVSAAAAVVGLTMWDGSSSEMNLIVSRFLLVVGAFLAVVSALPKGWLRAAVGLLAAALLVVLVVEPFATREVTPGAVVPAALWWGVVSAFVRLLLGALADGIECHERRLSKRAS